MAETSKPDPFDDAKKPGEPPPEVKRDRYGRYLLPNPETGNVQSWTRVTTFAKTVADMYNIDLYHQRLVVKGMAMRPDLYAQASGAHIEDKKTLNELADYAREAAGESAKARLGTALHTFTEKHDLGEKQRVPSPWDADVEAYAKCLKENHIKVIPEYVEATLIIPKFGCAGTIDRLLDVRGYDLPVPGDLKGLALDTPLPTPTGWTTMGAVQTGDAVLGSDGRLCRVTAKSDVEWKDCYRVTFDDGTSVVCDSDHRWLTRTDLDEVVRTTDEIRRTLFNPVKKRRWHRIANSRPLDLPERDLPIDPYVLGCWLGDGGVRGGTITKSRDLFEIIESDGHVLGIEQSDKRRPEVISRNVEGLRTALISAGLQYNKHVPDVYLRASYDQRLRLLQGLMDTDGTWNRPRNQAVFNSTDKRLAESVRELALSLGWRATMFEHEASGFGKTVTAYAVPFTPFDANPFRLPRKADLVDVGKATRARRRLIMSVEPAPSVPTQCIMVDSPDHTYLCGDQMVPTHNTGKSVQYAWMEIACQLFLYSQATHIYDHRTQELREMPTVDRSRGLVIHLPVEQAEATLYEIDLDLGGRVAAASEVVRGLRKRKDFATPWASQDEQVAETSAANTSEATSGDDDDWGDETTTASTAADDEWDTPSNPPPAPKTSSTSASKSAQQVPEQTSPTQSIDYPDLDELGVDRQGARYQHIKVGRQQYLLVDIEHGTTEEFKLLRDAKARKKELESGDDGVRPLGGSGSNSSGGSDDDDWDTETSTDDGGSEDPQGQVEQLRGEVARLRGDDVNEQTESTKRQWFAEIGSAPDRETLVQIFKEAKASGDVEQDKLVRMAKARQAEIDAQIAKEMDDDENW